MKQGIYIVVSENEIVKAEMERPNEPEDKDYSFAALYDMLQLIKWTNKHLTLPRIPIQGKHNWKVWQEVVGGRDFEFDLIDNGGWQGQWVAIPIEQTKSEQVEFSESEMKKVQDDIDGVNAGAVVDKVKLSGFPCDINELCDVLQNTCQLLLGIKPDAVEEKWWSDWDESVLQSNIKMLRQVQPFYRK